jgi:hypothetical protein
VRSGDCIGDLLESISNARLALILWKSRSMLLSFADLEFFAWRRAACASVRKSLQLPALRAPCVGRVLRSRSRAPSSSSSISGLAVCRPAQRSLRAFQTSSHGHRRAHSRVASGCEAVAPGSGRSSIRSSTSRPQRRSSRIMSPWLR